MSQYPFPYSQPPPFDDHTPNNNINQDTAQDPYDEYHNHHFNSIHHFQNPQHYPHPQNTQNFDNSNPSPQTPQDNSQNVSDYTPLPNTTTPAYDLPSIIANDTSWMQMYAELGINVVADPNNPNNPNFTANKSEVYFSPPYSRTTTKTHIPLKNNKRVNPRGGEGGKKVGKTDKSKKKRNKGQSLVKKRSNSGSKLQNRSNTQNLATLVRDEIQNKTDVKIPTKKNKEHFFKFFSFKSIQGKTQLKSLDFRTKMRQFDREEGKSMRLLGTSVEICAKQREMWGIGDGMDEGCDDDDDIYEKKNYNFCLEDSDYSDESNHNDNNNNDRNLSPNFGNINDQEGQPFHFGPKVNPRTLNPHFPLHPPPLLIPSNTRSQSPPSTRSRFQIPHSKTHQKRYNHHRTQDSPKTSRYPQNSLEILQPGEESSSSSGDDSCDDDNSSESETSDDNDSDTQNDPQLLEHHLSPPHSPLNSYSLSPSDSSSDSSDSDRSFMSYFGAQTNSYLSSLFPTSTNSSLTSSSGSSALSDDSSDDSSDDNSDDSSDDFEEISKQIDRIVQQANEFELNQVAKGSFNLNNIQFDGCFEHFQYFDKNLNFNGQYFDENVQGNCENYPNYQHYHNDDDENNLTQFGVRTLDDNQMGDDCHQQDDDIIEFHNDVDQIDQLDDEQVNQMILKYENSEKLSQNLSQNLFPKNKNKNTPNFPQISQIIYQSSSEEEEQEESEQEQDYNLQSNNYDQNDTIPSSYDNPAPNTVDLIDNYDETPQNLKNIPNSPNFPLFSLKSPNPPSFSPETTETTTETSEMNDGISAIPRLDDQSSVFDENRPFWASSTPIRLPKRIKLKKKPKSNPPAKKGRDGMKQLMSFFGEKMGDSTDNSGESSDDRVVDIEGEEGDGEDADCERKIRQIEKKAFEKKREKEKLQNKLRKIQEEEEVQQEQIRLEQIRSEEIKTQEDKSRGEKLKFKFNRRVFGIDKRIRMKSIKPSLSYEEWESVINFRPDEENPFSFFTKKEPKLWKNLEQIENIEQNIQNLQNDQIINYQNGFEPQQNRPIPIDNLQISQNRSQVMQHAIWASSPRICGKFFKKIKKMLQTSPLSPQKVLHPNPYRLKNLYEICYDFFYNSEIKMYQEYFDYRKKLSTKKNRLNLNLVENNRLSLNSVESNHHLGLNRPTARQKAVKAFQEGCGFIYSDTIEEQNGDSDDDSDDEPSFQIRAIINGLETVTDPMLENILEDEEVERNLERNLSSGSDLEQNSSSGSDFEDIEKDDSNMIDDDNDGILSQSKSELNPDFSNIALNDVNSNQNDDEKGINDVNNGGLMHNGLDGVDGGCGGGDIGSGSDIDSVYRPNEHSPSYYYLDETYTLYKIPSDGPFPERPPTPQHSFVPKSKEKIFISKKKFQGVPIIEEIPPQNDLFCEENVLDDSVQNENEKDVSDSDEKQADGQTFGEKEDDEENEESEEENAENEIEEAYKNLFGHKPRKNNNNDNIPSENDLKMIIFRDILRQYKEKEKEQKLNSGQKYNQFIRKNKKSEKKRKKLTAFEKLKLEYESAKKLYEEISLTNGYEFQINEQFVLISDKDEADEAKDKDKNAEKKIEQNAEQNNQLGQQNIQNNTQSYQSGQYNQQIGQTNPHFGQNYQITQQTARNYQNNQQFGQNNQLMNQYSHHNQQMSQYPQNNGQNYQSYHQIPPLHHSNNPNFALNSMRRYQNPPNLQNYGNYQQNNQNHPDNQHFDQNSQNYHQNDQNSQQFGHNNQQYAQNYQNNPQNDQDYQHYHRNGQNDYQNGHHYHQSDPNDHQYQNYHQNDQNYHQGDQSYHHNIPQHGQSFSQDGYHNYNNQMIDPNTQNTQQFAQNPQDFSQMNPNPQNFHQINPDNTQGDQNGQNGQNDQNDQNEKNRITPTVNFGYVPPPCLPAPPPTMESSVQDIGFFTAELISESSSSSDDDDDDQGEIGKKRFLLQTEKMTRLTRKLLQNFAHSKLSHPVKQLDNPDVRSLTQFLADYFGAQTAVSHWNLTRPLTFPFIPPNKIGKPTKLRLNPHSSTRNYDPTTIPTVKLNQIVSDDRLFVPGVRNTSLSKLKNLPFYPLNASLESSFNKTGSQGINYTFEEMSLLRPSNLVNVDGFNWNKIQENPFFPNSFPHTTSHELPPRFGHSPYHPSRSLFPHVDENEAALVGNPDLNRQFPYAINPLKVIGSEEPGLTEAYILPESGIPTRIGVPAMIRDGLRVTEQPRPIISIPSQVYMDNGLLQYVEPNEVDYNASLLGQIGGARPARGQHHSAPRMTTIHVLLDVPEAGHAAIFENYDKPKIHGFMHDVYNEAHLDLIDVAADITQREKTSAGFFLRPDSEPSLEETPLEVIEAELMQVEAELGKMLSKARKNSKSELEEICDLFFETKQGIVLEEDLDIILSKPSALSHDIPGNLAKNVKGFSNVFKIDKNDENGDKTGEAPGIFSADIENVGESNRNVPNPVDTCVAAAVNDHTPQDQLDLASVRCDGGDDGDDGDDDDDIDDDDSSKSPPPPPPRRIIRGTPRSFMKTKATEESLKQFLNSMIRNKLQNNPEENEARNMAIQNVARNVSVEWCSRFHRNHNNDNNVPYVTEKPPKQDPKFQIDSAVIDSLLDDETEGDNDDDIDDESISKFEKIEKKQKEKLLSGILTQNRPNFDKRALFRILRVQILTHFSREEIPDFDPDLFGKIYDDAYQVKVSNDIKRKLKNKKNYQNGLKQNFLQKFAPVSTSLTFSSKKNNNSNIHVLETSHFIDHKDNNDDVIAVQDSNSMVIHEKYQLPQQVANAANKMIKNGIKHDHPNFVAQNLAPHLLAEAPSPNSSLNFHQSYPSEGAVVIQPTDNSAKPIILQRSDKTMIVRPSDAIHYQTSKNAMKFGPKISPPEKIEKIKNNSKKINFGEKKSPRIPPQSQSESRFSMASLQKFFEPDGSENVDNLGKTKLRNIPQKSKNFKNFKNSKHGYENGKKVSQMNPKTNAMGEISQSLSQNGNNTSGNDPNMIELARCGVRIKINQLENGIKAVEFCTFSQKNKMEEKNNTKVAYFSVNNKVIPSSSVDTSVRRLNKSNLIQIVQRSLQNKQEITVCVKKMLQNKNYEKDVQKFDHFSSDNNDVSSDEETINRVEIIQSQLPKVKQHHTRKSSPIEQEHDQDEDSEDSLNLENMFDVQSSDLEEEPEEDVDENVEEKKDQNLDQNLDNEKVFEKYFQYVGIFDEDDEDDEDVDDIYILDSSTGSIDSLSSTSSILNHNSDADADAEASVDYSNDTSCSEYEEDSTREEITPQTSPQKSSKNLESLSYRFIPPQAITPRFHDENLPPYPITFYPILSESSGSGSENETQTSHSDSFSTTTSLESPPIPPSVETPQERTPVDSTSPIPATNEAKNNETEEKEKEKEDDKDLPPPILPLSPSLPIDISFQVEDQVEIFPTQIIVDQIGISTTFVRHHFPLFDPIGLKITQHDDRLSLTVLINQAEIMERWDDMALLTRQLVILSNGCLTVTERRAFAVAHKQCIQPRRQAIRSLRYPFVDEDMRQVMDLSLDHVEYETITFCKSLIQFITAHVLRATLSAADEYVFWLRLVADSYRYIAEINVGSDFDSCRLARSYYHDAALLAERYLHISDPIRLGLLLNYSVASFELFNDYKTACGMLKTAFSKAVLRLDDLSPAEFTDSILLLQLMRDNLLLWTTMVAAENECDVNRVEQDDEKDDEDDDENDGSDEDDEDEDDGRGGRIGENKENKENKEKVNSIEDEWLREAIRLKKIEDKLLRKKEPKKWWERNKVNKKEGVERREDRPIRKAIIFQTPFEIQMSAAHPRNYPIRLPVNNSNSYLVPKLPPKEYNDVDEEDYFGDQKGRNATFNGVSSVNGVDNFNYIDDDDDNDDDDDDDWDDYDGEGEEGGNYDPYNDDYSPSYFDEYDRHHNNQE